MGTRALIRVVDECRDPSEIACFYNHWDGYPSALGAKIKEGVGHVQLVNGIRGDMDEAKIANGMGRFATRLVQEIDDLSAEAPGTHDIGELYTYVLCGNTMEPGPIHLRVYYRLGPEEPIYDGPLANFDGDAVEASQNEDEPAP